MFLYVSVFGHKRRTLDASYASMRTTEVKNRGPTSGRCSSVVIQLITLLVVPKAVALSKEGGSGSCSEMIDVFRSCGYMASIELITIYYHI